MEGANVAVTGGAGFIGSHLAEKLSKNNKVIVLDDFSSGSLNNISAISSKISLAKRNIANLKSIRHVFKDCDSVFHLAANPDVSLGGVDNYLQLRRDVIGTYNVLESARLCDVETVVFASSSTVYGEANRMPIIEDYSPMLPISFYGASKLAGEAYMSVFSNNYGINVVILRLANVIGPRSNHGVVYQFVKQLEKDGTMTILSGGNQKKSYLYVDDCVDGFITAAKANRKGCHTYNLGSADSITVKEIAKAISEEVGIKPRFLHKRVWVGDVPYFELSIDRIKKTGWAPKHSSLEAVKLTARYLH
ncbi:MAG: NAD-dependent epimerase/dehydratase family protein [Candidatus Micrarchaeota archaeon]|nr:NAD-dependent epimerase/dehydratase family protein [Candidatus Micrarchaeota archaeon]